MQFNDLFPGDGMTVGEKVRKYRTKRKMTQERLAEMAGVSRKTISRLENKNMLPDVDVMIRIASAISMPPSLMLKGSEPSWYGNV